VTKNIPSLACFGKIKQISKPSKGVSPVSISAYEWGTATAG